MRAQEFTFNQQGVTEGFGDPEEYQGILMSMVEGEEGLALRKQIRRVMKQKGWHQVGSGFFSLVFTKKDQNRVRKIIAPEAEVVQGSANDLQSSFVEYVMQHRTNPHLPRFYKTSGIKVGPLRMSVYNMEKLRPLSDDNLLLTEAVVRAAMQGGSLLRTWQTLRGIYASDQPEWDRLYKHWPTFRDRFKVLYSTVVDLQRKAKQRGAFLDMFNVPGAENIMQRVDGTPVVIDPWAPDA